MIAASWVEPAAGLRTIGGMTADANTLPLPALYSRFAQTGYITRLLNLAREEDLAERGDVTSVNCLPPGKQGRGVVVARKGGVIAGLACVPDILNVFGGRCSWVPSAIDGGCVAAGRTLGVVCGPMVDVLAIERTLLNLVGRLSGIATRTSEFAARIRGIGRARLYDTRKTTPGMRVLEKYAVRCGGGFCHRLGLHDAMLIKDNHIVGVGDAELATYVRAAADRARATGPLLFVQVEVDRRSQLESLVSLPSGVVDIVLLDNMSIAELTDCAALRAARAPWLELEASGGVSLDTIAAIASTGVDRISVGGLTHQAVSLDVALDVQG